MSFSAGRCGWPAWGGTSDGWRDASFALEGLAGKLVQFGIVFASDQSVDTRTDSSWFGAAVSDMQVVDRTSERVLYDTDALEPVDQQSKVPQHLTSCVSDTLQTDFLVQCTFTGAQKSLVAQNNDNRSYWARNDRGQFALSEPLGMIAEFSWVQLDDSRLKAKQAIGSVRLNARQIAGLEAIRPSASNQTTARGVGYLQVRLVMDTTVAADGAGWRGDCDWFETGKLCDEWEDSTEDWLLWLLPEGATPVRQVRSPRITTGQAQVLMIVGEDTMVRAEQSSSTQVACVSLASLVAIVVLMLPNSI